jgi:hypothetical protein
MAYTLSKTNGGTLVLLNEGIVDTSVSSIGLIGKNVSNFGDIQNENFLHMLENFAFNVQPRSPITGQLWFNTSESVNRPAAFDGVNWRPLAVLQYGTTTTNALVNSGGSNFASSRPGDLWFDSVNKQLHVVTSGTNAATETTLIGPELVTGFATTRMASAKMFDTSNAGHAVIQTIVNGEVLSIQSTDEFTQTSTNPVAGFPKVYRGITFKNFSTSTKFTTSTSDVALYGILNHLDLSFTRNTIEEHLVANWTVDDTYALQFGTTAQSSVAWSSSNLVLTSTAGIKLQSATTALTFDGASVTASANTVNLGTSSALFATAYVANISGGTSSAVGNITGDWRLTTGSKFSPTFDIQNDLGTTALRFNTIYATKLNAGSSSNAGNITGAWSLTTGSNIAPVVDLGNDLGSASNRFDTVYASKLSIVDSSATITVTGSLEIDGDVMPAVDNALSLGSSSTMWSAVYASDVQATSIEATTVGATVGTFDTLSVGDQAFASLIDSLSNTITRFDTDGTLGGNSNSFVATQRAVKTYVDAVKAQLQASLNNIQTVPTGAIFYTAAASAPAGYVIADGSSYSINGATAALFTTLGYTYGGSGGSFNVPDLRGQFVRGDDRGRGLDSGRAHGSTQADSFRSHGHLFDDIRWSEVSGSYTYSDPQLGVISVGPGAGSNKGTDYDNGAHFIQHGTYNTGGGETRPTNIALLPIIKL